ncbi:alpha/beta fold hydrolase [Kiritimatiellaeota bacterium B1221]|nr:alpha/beta fold hydrolase [Kiritimatiellaeota bacterium B1221]
MKKCQMQLGGKKLAYLDEGEGPVLVFGHSYLWTSGMWAAQVRGLSDSYRCIVPELWGHGDSDPVGECEAYHLDTLTDDMERFVNELGIDTFAMIGLSVGGMWGARLAHRLPGRVEKLVLMDTDVGAEPAASQAKFLGMIGMAAAAGAFPPPLVEAVLPFFFCDATLQNDPAMVEAYRQSLLQWRPDAMGGTLAVGRGVFARENFLPQLAEINCPALVMAGEQDRSRPPAEAKVLADTLPNSELKIIPDAGHIPSVEQPELVSGHLRDFLSC